MTEQSAPVRPLDGRPADEVESFAIFLFLCQMRLPFNHGTGILRTDEVTGPFFSSLLRPRTEYMNLFSPRKNSGFPE